MKVYGTLSHSMSLLSHALSAHAPALKLFGRPPFDFRGWWRYLGGREEKEGGGLNLCATRVPDFYCLPPRGILVLSNHGQSQQSLQLKVQEGQSMRDRADRLETHCHLLEERCSYLVSPPTPE